MVAKHTNNEISIIVENLDNKLTEKHADIVDTLNRIETQTTKTNGRVTTLEKFMWIVVGVTAVFTTLIIPIFLKTIKQI